MRTRIKFCGLVDAQDVRTGVALGVDAIGLVFHPGSPRALDVVHAAGLRRMLPSYVAAIGLFVDAPDGEVRRIADAVGLDVIQFHGDETPQRCEHERPLGTAYWRAVRMRGGGDLLESSVRFRSAELLLLDSYSAGYGGSGETFDWSWIPAQRALPIALSGGLTPENVMGAIERVRPALVDVSSGIQADAPDGTPRGQARRKSNERMERFVAEVLRADAALLEDPQ